MTEQGECPWAMPRNAICRVTNLMLIVMDCREERMHTTHGITIVSECACAAFYLDWP